jgi:tetratricopeptide (TPR) repeat protein
VASAPGELAVVAGIVEQLKGGTAGAADANALAAAWTGLAAHAQSVGARFDHVGGARFSLTFSGDQATAHAVAVARANVRLSARLGRDVLLRLAVVSDGDAPIEFAARMRSVGERLVAQAAPGASVITEDARVRCGGDLTTGRSATVSQPDGSSVLAHELVLARRLVGRSAEILAFDDMLADVATSRRASQTVLVGDGGAGRTALSHAAASFAHDRGFLVGVARGAQVSGAPTFDVVRQLLRASCLDLLARERSLEAWSHALEVLAVPEPVAARVRALVDDDGDGGLTGFPAPRRRAVLFAAILAVFDKLSERSPLLLVVDDADRADAVSLELLAELAVRRAERPIAVLAVSRPASAERVLARARRIAVGPLTAADAIGVAGLTLGAALSAPLAQLVATHGKGSPLTVVALIRWLLATGALAGGPTGIGLQADAGRLAVPAGLTALLQAQHAALPPPVQAVLKTAVGLGMLIEPAHVGAVVEGVADVAGALRRLADAGVVEALPDDRWLVRSLTEWELAAAVDDPMFALRARARRAEFFAHTVATRAQLDVAERLSEHLIALEAVDHIFDVASYVAGRLEAFGLLEQAASQWRQALAFEVRRNTAAPSVDGAARALRCAARATACLVEVNPATAVDVVLPALGFVRAAPAVAADALRHRAVALARRKRFMDAEGGLAQALEVLATGNDDAVACDVLVDVAAVLEQRGDDAGALQRTEEALRRFAAARAANPELPADRGFDALLLHSRLVARRGRGAEVRATLRRALDGIRAAGRSAVEVDALLLIATTAEADGDADGALAAMDEAVTAGEAAAEEGLVARALQQLGRSQLARGRSADATATFRRALEAARASLWDDGVAALERQLQTAGAPV